MHITKNSKKIMSLISQHNWMHHISDNKKTESIILQLYKDINNAHHFLLTLKNKKDHYYKLTTKKIISSTQIAKPQNFNANSFPEQVRKQIDNYAAYELNYSFSLFDRNIKIIFTLEEDNNEVQIATFNKYVDIVVMWLYILNEYASKQCANNLCIYFYFTSLEKSLPSSNIYVLDELHVNTAFTTTCPKESEIVIFRKEEWFKVFIHETFHNFGLDFSDMNNTEVTDCILNFLRVNSDVNLYESYTEIWAEIINAIFCSFLSLKDKNNVELFLHQFDVFINLERNYSFLQLVKILDFMGLSYKDLYRLSHQSKILRDNLYKEKTNVLSYYVIKTILLNNYPSFLMWCQKNNTTVLQFKKTSSNQQSYCKLIERNYKTHSMLESIEDAQMFLNNLKKKKKDKHTIYMLNNLRMSICELG